MTSNQCYWVLQDPHFFVKAHEKIGKGPRENYSNIRVLHYPPVSLSGEIIPGQIRCGEHVDYGSITLLFQDQGAGLQVQLKFTPLNGVATILNLYHCPGEK